jgi:hypothetical protein
MKILDNKIGILHNLIIKYLIIINANDYVFI